MGKAPNPRGLGALVLALAGAVLAIAGADAPAAAQQRSRGENRQVLKPTQDYKVCFPLARNESLTYTFRSDQPLDFNIHYVEDDQVHIPVRNTGLLGLSDSFLAPASRTYCLTWINPQVVGAELFIRLGGP